MICPKCKGKIFESKKAVVTFMVDGGSASFTTDGMFCVKCNQSQVQFKVNVKEASIMKVEETKDEKSIKG